MELEYKSSVERGLDHIRGHAESYEDGLKQFLKFIDTNTGDPESCILSLASHAAARCLVSWFADHNLIDMKQWAYVAAKLRMIYFLRKGPGRGSLSVASYEILYPLISDNKTILDWYIGYDDGFHSADRNNPRKAGFHDYQALLALRRDFASLAERSKRFLAEPPKSRNKYTLDFEFYLALANGDSTKMRETVTELTTPKFARKRNHDFGMGFTHFFIGTDALVLAKIARLSGYDIQIDSPFVPREWLPVQPLAAYVDPYRFMTNY